MIYGIYWYFQPQQSIVMMDNQPKGSDGNKSYASFKRHVDTTVASLKFKIGTVQGNLLLELCFMAVILFSNSSFKDVGVDVLISPTMQPCEEVPDRMKYVLRTALQNFDDRKMFYSVQNEKPDEDLKLIHPKVAGNYDFSDQQYLFSCDLFRSSNANFSSKTWLRRLLLLHLWESRIMSLKPFRTRFSSTF